MPITDPRRGQEKDRAFVKPSAVFGITAFALLRATHEYKRMYVASRMLIERMPSAMETHATFTPLFSAIEIKDVEGKQKPEAFFPGRKVDFSDQAFYQVDKTGFSGIDQATPIETEKYKKLKSSTGGRALSAKARDIIHKKAEKISIALQPAEPTRADLFAAAMAKSSSLLERFQREYPAIEAILGKCGIIIERLQRHPNGYRLIISDSKGNRSRVVLPHYEHGIVRRGSGGFIYVGTVKVHNLFEPGGVQVVQTTFGYDLQRRLEKSIEKAISLSGDTNHARAAAQKIAFEISSLLDEFAETQSESAALLMEKFIVQDLKVFYEQKGSESLRRALKEYPKLLHGARILKPDPNGNLRLTDEFLSFISISDQSFVGKAKVATATRWNQAIAPRLNRASTFRPNFMKGRLLVKKETIDKIAEAAGPIPRDVLYKLSENMNEAMPGGMVNVSFWKGRVEDVGKGGALVIVDRKREGATVFDKLSGTRTRVFEVSEGYSVTKVDSYGSIRMYKEVRDLLDKIERSIIDPEYGKKIGFTRLYEGSNSGPIRLPKGTVLGYEPGTKNLIVTDKDYYLRSVSFDKGMVRFEVAEEIPLAPGTTKLAVTKAVVQKVIGRESLMNHLPAKGVLDKQSMYLLQKGLLTGATEVLFEADIMSKLRGGAIGLGMFNKVISDLAQMQRIELKNWLWKQTRGRKPISKEALDKKVGELVKALREVGGFMLGSEDAFNRVVDEINLGTDSPIVILREGLSTNNIEFYELLKLEDDLVAAFGGDMSKIEKIKRWAEALEKKIEEATGIKGYKVTNLIARQASATTKGKRLFRNLPMIMFDRSQAGIVNVNIRIYEAPHATSAYKYDKVARLTRTHHGFTDGVKLTLDHIVNAHMAGLKQHAAFMHTLLDYNFTYLEDKANALTKMLTRDEYYALTRKRYYSGRFFGHWQVINKDKPNNVFGIRRDKSIALLDLETFGEDFISKLADGFLANESAANAIRFRINTANVASLGAATADEAETLLRGTFTIDELVSRGVLGLRGNSVGIIEAETMERLMTIINSAPKDSVIYLKLPFQLKFGKETITHVPIHRFDKANMFELVASVSPDGTPREMQVTKRFLTGSDFIENQMSFIRKIAEITESARKAEGNKELIEALKARATIAVKMYRNGLRRAFAGKMSSAKRALTEVSMPYSAQGRVRTMTSLPYGVVAMHPDDIVKMVTGNVLQSVDDVNAYLRYAEEVSDTVMRIKAISAIIENKPENYVELVRNLYFDVNTQLMSMVERYPKDLADRVTAIKRRWNKKLLVLANRKHVKLLAQAGETVKNNLITRLTDIEERLTRLNKVLNLSLVAREVLQDLGMKYDEEARRFVVDQTAGGYIKPKRLIVVRVDRPPYLSEHTSGKYLQLVASNDNRGVSRAVLRELGKDNMRKMLQGAQGMFLMNMETLESMHGDVDADNLFAHLVSYEYLDEVSSRIKGLKPVTEKLKLAGVHTRKWTIEALTELVSQFAVVTEGEHIIPANSSAVGIVAAISEKGFEKMILTNELEKHTAVLVQKALPHASGKERAKITRQIIKSIKEKAKETFGEQIDTSKIKVISVPKGVAYTAKYHVDIYNKEVVKSKLDRHGTMAKKRPDLLAQSLIQGLSKEQIQILDAVQNANKEELAQFLAAQARDQLEDFPRIKTDTPTAYKLRTAIRHVLEREHFTEREKMLLDLFAVEKVAQSTISAKHGIPDILGDVIATLKEMAKPDIGLKTELLEKVATNNWKVSVTEGVAKEMKQWKRMKKGEFETTYKELIRFLEDSEEFTRALLEAHEAAGLEVAKMISRGDLQEDLKRYYRSHVEGFMKNYKLTSGRNLPEIEGLDSWIYYKNLVEEKLQDVRERLANVKKHQVTLFEKAVRMGKKGSPAEIEKAAQEEIKSLMKKFAAAAKMYHYQHGVSIFQDPATKALTQFGRQGLSIWDLIEEELESHKAGARRVYSTREHWLIGRFVSFLQGGKDAAGVIGDVSKSRRLKEIASRIEDLKRRERAAMAAMRAANIEKESTVFRSGSIIDALLGRTIKHTASREADQLLHSAKRYRAASIVAGLLLGIIAGQTVNQISSGYAVPDLEHVKGLGGEYYEHRSGIMGTKAEYFTRHEGPRVQPLYDSEFQKARMSDIRSDIIMAHMPKEHQKQYMPKMRGIRVG